MPTEPPAIAAIRVPASTTTAATMPVVVSESVLTGSRGRFTRLNTSYWFPNTAPSTIIRIVTSRPVTQTPRPWLPPENRDIRPAT
ncbi:MAG: hypothetical protein HOQ45_09620 [Nocardioidaceae bacterium]|nr:hypothetical protein [Nocardioidaceae bacterium]